MIGLFGSRMNEARGNSHTLLGSVTSVAANLSPQLRLLSCAHKLSTNLFSHSIPVCVLCHHCVSVCVTYDLGDESLEFCSAGVCVFGMKCNVRAVWRTCFFTDSRSLLFTQISILQTVQTTHKSTGFKLVFSGISFFFFFVQMLKKLKDFYLQPH